MNDLNWTWSAARKKTHTQTNSEYLIIRRFSFTLSKCSCVRRYSCSSFKCSQSMSYKYLLTLLEACIIHESTPYHIYKHRHSHTYEWLRFELGMPNRTHKSFTSTNRRQKTKFFENNISKINVQMLIFS